MKSINAMYHEDLIKLTSKTLAKAVADSIIKDVKVELALQLKDELFEMYDKDIKTPRYVVFADSEIFYKADEAYKSIERILYRFVESNEDIVKFDDADVSMATHAFFNEYGKAKEAIFNGVLDFFYNTSEEALAEVEFDDEKPYTERTPIFDIVKRDDSFAIIRINAECRDEYPLWLCVLGDNVHAFRKAHNEEDDLK